LNRNNDFTQYSAIVLERQRREMQQPGATPQELEITMAALKARNEVAASGPRKTNPLGFISRLQRSMV
jgi:hypothetical protein